LHRPLFAQQQSISWDNGAFPDSGYTLEFGSHIRHQFGSTRCGRKSAAGRPKEPTGQTTDAFDADYTQSLLTEIVRVIGYETLSVGEAKHRIEPLCDRFGAEQVTEAINELLEIKDGTKNLWGLSDDVRRYARALLGPPPITQQSLRPTISPTRQRSSSDSFTGEKPLAKASRKLVIARLRHHLEATGEDISEVPADVRTVLSRHGCMTPDLMIADEFLAVRQTLSAAQRHDMQKWLEVSDYCHQATQAWPRETNGGWEWVYDVVASKHDEDQSGADDVEQVPN
jgi:hypothetical protein